MIEFNSSLKNWEVLEVNRDTKNSSELTYLSKTMLGLAIALMAVFVACASTPEPSVAPVSHTTSAPAAIPPTTIRPAATPDVPMVMPGAEVITDQPVGSGADYEAFIMEIDPDIASTFAGSWRADCPVPLDDLRLVRVRHWDFDGNQDEGWLVVHSNVANDVVDVFEELFAAEFPIERIQLIDVFDNDDDQSMQANNTSAFNCRSVAGTNTWSQHAYGTAIDINPLLNPFVTNGGSVFPPEGANFLDRTADTPGLIQAGGVVVEAFAGVGWKWGGDWLGSKDYQHFSVNGR